MAGDAALAVHGRLARPARFALVAAISTSIDIGLLCLLTLAGVPVLLANVASYASAAACNYRLNARFTFPEARKAPSPEGSLRRVAAFALVKACTLGLSTISLAAALQLLPLLAAKAVSIAVTFGVSFLLSSRLVFVTRSTGRPVS